jgi:hypothetical protein
MKSWFIVRLLLVAVSFLQGAFIDLPLAPPEDVSAQSLVFIFGFGIFGMLFVIGIQRVNPRSAPTWRYPSWYINPFLLREPLQFFHLGGFIMFAVVAGGALRAVVSGQPLRFSLLLPLVFGIGTLVGVYACTFVFRGKMELPNKPLQPIAPKDGAPVER